MKKSRHSTERIIRIPGEAARLVAERGVSIEAVAGNVDGGSP